MQEITIREAISEAEEAVFWEQLQTYFKRDIFPDPGDEDREYFLGENYRSQIKRIHDRLQDRCYYLFFYRGGQDIGFSLSTIDSTKDGNCFIMEFCVYPEFRGGGTGKACAGALLRWAKTNGALYAELNDNGVERRRRFWQSMGFLENGVDEWGEPLMILPPKDDMPVTVEVLSDPEEWQLKKLENGFFREIGETALTEERQTRLSQAVRDGKIIFFVARRGSRAVGMCSVAGCFSTYACADIGVFDDFYIEPVFRKKGIARKLTQAAQEWCRDRGIISLSVCCAPCDEERYRDLGFTVRLGTTLACQML